MTTPSAKRCWTALALVAIMALGLGLRMWRLHDECPWFDEVASIACLDARSLPEYLAREQKLDTNMTPVYFTLQYLWARVAGTSPYAIRLLSILFAMLTIPVIFAIGRRLAGLQAGLLAAALLALSLCHIYYSQEIRVYSLTVLLAAVSSHALLRAIEPGSRRAWWLLHGAANLLLAFTHLFTVLFLVAQGAFLLYRGRDRRLLLWTAFHGAVGVALVCWFVAIGLGQSTAAIQWIPTPSPLRFITMMLLFAGGRASTFPGLYTDNPAYHLPGGISFDIPIAAIMGLLTAAALIQALRGRLPKYPIALLILWLALPPLALFLASFIVPCFVYRYILYVIPALYVLAAAGITTSPPRLRLPAAAIVLALLAYQSIAACAASPFRPDLYAITRFLATEANPGQTLAVPDGFLELPMQYVGAPPGLNLRMLDQDVPIPEGAERIAKAEKTFWLIHWPMTWSWRAQAPWPDIDPELKRLGLDFQIHPFSGWPPVFLYKISAPQQ